jgi:GNAT superfamily N-acetyltransferase
MNQATIKPLELVEQSQIQIKIAQTSAEINQCKSLISEIYYQKLGITFSDSISDAEAKIEVYPQYYLMALCSEILIGTIGLYTNGTNAERHGKVTEQDVNILLTEAKVINRYLGKYLRELTKFVVKDEWQNKGIGKVLLAAAHSQDFIHINEEKPHVLVSCATFSIFEYFANALNIRTRRIKPMPFYKVHEHYRSHDNPLETRLSIPDIDIPKELYFAKLPFEYTSAKLTS